jgi:hypothetical protein
VTGEWGNLHNEELNYMYSSPNIVRAKKSRKMRLAGYVALIGRGLYRILVWKPEGKRTLGSPRLIREDNSSMDLQDMGGGTMDWFELTQDCERWRAIVTAVMNHWVPNNAGNFLTS